MAVIVSSMCLYGREEQMAGMSFQPLTTVNVTHPHEWVYQLSSMSNVSRWGYYSFYQSQMLKESRQVMTHVILISLLKFNFMFCILLNAFLIFPLDLLTHKYKFFYIRWPYRAVAWRTLMCGSILLLPHKRPSNVFNRISL